MKNKLHDDSREIFNCKAGVTINPKYYSYNLGYQDKSLIAYSDRLFKVFNAKTEKFMPEGLIIDVYKESIYAKKGVIYKSNATFILTPPKFSKKAIAEVNNMFQKKIQNPKQIHVSEYLLGATLSGDKVSRERLLTFAEYFPKDKELYMLTQQLEILKDFDNYVKNGGKIKYLDLSVYGL